MFIKCLNSRITTRKMKGQTFSSILLTALLAFVFLASMVSATDFSLGTSSITLTKSSPSANFTITALNYTDFTITAPIIKDDNGNNMVINLVGNTINTNFTTIMVSASPNYDALSLGKSYSGSISVVDANNASFSHPVTLSIEKDYCDFGQNGSSIEITSIDDNKDFDWNPLDNVTIEVEVKNKATVKQKVTVEISLYSPSEDKFEKIDGSKTYIKQSMKISDEDSETYKFNFKVSPKFGEHTDYKMFVKAYLDSDEASLCTSKVEKSVSVDYGDDEILIDNIQKTDVLSCGQTDRISFDLYNLNYGDNEDFRVRLFNNELGISEYSSRFNLDNGDSQNVAFDLAIPSDVSNKEYDMVLDVQYDYSESSDTFSKSDSNFGFNIKVNNCNKLSVVLDDSQFKSLNADKAVVKAGSEVTYQIPIRNAGTSSETYTLSIVGNSWSTSAPKTITVGPGEALTTSLTLNVNEDAPAGDQTFTIRIASGALYKDIPVAIKVGSGTSSNIIFNNIKSNWFIYLIILINIVLIVAIIVAIMRLSGRRARKE